MESTLLMLCLFASPIILCIGVIIIKQNPDIDYHHVHIEEETAERPKLPTGQNVIAMRDAEALAYISKHPAMNTHRNR